MTPDEVDEFDVLIEEYFFARNTAECFELLDALDRSPSSRISTFAALSRGTLLLQLGRVDEATELLHRVVPVIQEQDVRMRAHAEGALGLAALPLGRHEEVDTRLGEASRLFSDLQLWWKVSAVEINLAINDCYVGKYEDCLERLERSWALVRRASVPDHWREVRFGMIDINRAGAFTPLGQQTQAAQCLLRARKRLRDAGEGARHLLAKTDLNLALTYLSRGMYGSGLEAARQSADGFSGGENISEERRAQVCVGKSLTRLGRIEEAEQLLLELVAIGEREVAQEVWHLEALMALEQLYRRSGRRSKADATVSPARQALVASISEPMYPEFVAITAVSDVIDRLAEIVTMSETDLADIRSDLASEAEPLRRSRSPVGPAVAQLIDDLAEVLRTGELSVEVEEQINQVFGAFGDPHGQQLVASLRLGIGLRIGPYDDALCKAALLDLYEEQQLVRVLEDESFRSRALALGSSQELRTALVAAARAEQAELMAEVIEFCRSAPVASLSSPNSSALPTFRELETSGESKSLAVPTQIGVDGRSRMAEARQSGDFVDLSTARTQWGGSDAGWLSLMVHGGAIYWSFLSDGARGHGQERLSQSLAESLDAVRRSHTRTLDADADVAGDGAPEWHRDTVALARASVGPLVAKPGLKEACLAALPTTLRKRTAAYIDESTPRTFSRDLETIGAHVIPSVVRDWLADRGGRRLLLSVPSDLSDVPWPLLPVDGSEHGLIEFAALQIAPPPELIRFIQPPCKPPRRLLLDVVNPTGDLTHARSFQASVHRLHGWDAARSPDDLATAQNIVSALSGLDTNPGVASFVGHIRPGTPENPGSAALRLASRTAGGRPTYLSAHDIINMAPSVPTHAYLGGCEGTGLGTGLEWAAVPAALLLRGSICVISHAWPLIDDELAEQVDRSCVDALQSAPDPVDAVWRAQVGWYRDWCVGQSAPAPHWWAGIHIISRSHESAERV